MSRSERSTLTSRVLALDGAGEEVAFTIVSLGCIDAWPADLAAEAAMKG